MVDGERGGLYKRSRLRCFARLKNRTGIGQKSINTTRTEIISVCGF